MLKHEAEDSSPTITVSRAVLLEAIRVEAIAFFRWSEVAAIVQYRAGGLAQNVLDRLSATDTEPAPQREGGRGACS